MLDARPGDGAPGGVAFSPEFVHRLTQEESSAMTEYKCPDCGYIYDEAKGNPHEGFAPNTTWAQIPDDWACPDCAVRDKADFIPLLAQGASATAIETGEIAITDLHNLGMPFIRYVNGDVATRRSEEHTSELPSLMRNSYDVLCLKK